MVCGAVNLWVQMRSVRNLFVLMALLATHAANAQLPGIRIARATGTITLNAVLDEPDWQTAETAKNFKQYFPYDTSLSIVKKRKCA